MKNSIKVFFLFLIIFLYPVFSFSSESEKEKEKSSSNEVIVWYLGHCGYAIKTENHLLIFDYIELEEQPNERALDKGFVDPEEIKDLNVSVFVTHSHVDHYDEIIFSWEKVVKNIRYFFGWKAKASCISSKTSQW